MRRTLAVLSFALIAFGLAAAPGAVARRQRPALTWKPTGPVALGPGPRYSKRSPAPDSGWTSTGSAPVLSVGPRNGLAAWAGPNAEVLAALAPSRGDKWGALAQPNAGVPALPETPEVVAALDPLGDALVGWQSQQNERYPESWQFGLGYRDAKDAGWSPASVLGSSDSTTTIYRRPTAPAVAFDGRGDGVAVWTQLGGNGIESGFMPSGTGVWQSPSVAFRGNTSSTRPEIAVDGAGDTAALWEFGGPRGEQLGASMRRPGRGWTTPVTLGPAGAASIVALPGRNVLAVWRVEGEHEKSALAYAVGNLANGRWGQTAELASSLLNPHFGVAVGTRGERIAWWTTTSKLDGRVTMRARVWHRRARGWAPPATIATWRPIAEAEVAADPTCTGSVEPAVTFDGRENAVATWEEGCGAVFDSWLPAGAGRWSAPGNLSRVIRRKVAPVLALRADGELLAVWLEPGAREAATATKGEQLMTTVEAAALAPAPRR